MPKKIVLPKRDDCYRSSGIDITWTKSAQRLDVGGWYDDCVGIESTSMSLREFFDLLGIKQSDTERAWR